MSDKLSGHNKEDPVLALTETAVMKAALFTSLAAITAAVLVSHYESTFPWQTPVLMTLAAIAAWLEKDGAVWLKRRSNQEIHSRQDLRWRQRWEKNVSRFYSLSLLCFAGAIVSLLPIVQSSLLPHAWKALSYLLPG